MPQCESCKSRGARYRCKKCVKYFFELIPKTKYNEVNILNEKGGKYKKKNKSKNKKSVKAQPRVEDEEKGLSLEIEETGQPSSFENKIENQLNDYISDMAPYGFYNIY